MHISSLAHHYANLLHHLTSLPLTSSSLLRLRSVHARILTSGFIPRAHILNRLLHLYTLLSDLPSALLLFDPTSPDIISRTTLLTAHSNSGNLPLARQLFDQTPLKTRDTVFYNAMISAYSRASDGLPALEIFRDMMRWHSLFARPDNYTFTGILSAAASILGIDIVISSHLHCAVIKSGTGNVVSVLNALIALYFKCDEDEAVVYVRRVFDEMGERDELTWTTMVVGFVRRGDVCTARQVFDEMGGKFDVVWNAMISGYVHHGLFDEAFDLFRRMILLGIKLDEFTYTSVLSACANSGRFKDGKAVHAHLVRLGPDFDPDAALPVENVLVTMYSKCGKVDVARRIFREIRKKDGVSWNAILSGYLDSERIEDALEVFNKMPHKNQLTWMVLVSGSPL